MKKYNRMARSKSKVNGRIFLVLLVQMIVFWTAKGYGQDAYEQKFQQVKLSAEKGDVASQAELGRMYFRGMGVKQNLPEALVWTKKAASMGNSEAQNNLGVFYYKGEVVERDYAQARKWFLMAAKQGNPKAQDNLLLPDPNEVAKMAVLDNLNAERAQNKGSYQAPMQSRDSLKEFQHSNDNVKFFMANQFAEKRMAQQQIQKQEQDAYLAALSTLNNPIATDQQLKAAEACIEYFKEKEKRMAEDAEKREYARQARVVNGELEEQKSKIEKQQREIDDIQREAAKPINGW